MFGRILFVPKRGLSRCIKITFSTVGMESSKVLPFVRSHVTSYICPRSCDLSHYFLNFQGTNHGFSEPRDYVAGLHAKIPRPGQERTS